MQNPGDLTGTHWADPMTHRFQIRIEELRRGMTEMITSRLVGRANDSFLMQ